MKAKSSSSLSSNITYSSRFKLILSLKETLKADTQEKIKPEDSTSQEVFVKQLNRTIDPLIKFEKQVFSDSVNYQQNKKREVFTKLTFIQTTEATFAECISQGLLQTLKTFKAVKDVTFILYRLHDDQKALKGLENCFNARFSSLNSINFYISNECDYPRSHLETTFESLNAVIKILRKCISLDKISINLNLCNTLDSTVSSTKKRLFSALNRFPALKRIHLNIYSSCGLPQHIPCDNEYVESVSEFLNKKTHLKDLELNLSTYLQIINNPFYQDNK